MNRIYRTLWSAATQSWQAVPETAKTAGKKSKSSAGGVVASVALGLSLQGGAGAQSPPAPPPAINQLPTGGNVARGTATISQTATAQAAAMVVNQSSQRAVVNWNTFNVGSNASVNFVQPNAQAVTLNRVNDSNPSQIFGRITANGQVFITNANGIYFSPTSSVDVGAITATTHSITDDNFMSGKYVFERNGSTGKVINEGNITAALGGYVALLAPEVQNAGVVVARAGTVTMAAGELITLNIDGAGSLAGITTTPSTIDALIENKLAVLAPDGQIILSAVALDKLQAGVVKNSGTLEANSLVNKGGKIVLEGDDIVMDRNSKIEAKGRTGGGVVLVGGDWQGSGDMRQATKVTMEAGASIDASATDKGDGGKVVLWSDVHNADSVTRANGSIKAEAGPNGGDGGQIETSGHYLNVDGIQVSTQSTKGNAGEWLLDPYDITISATGATFNDVNNPGDDSYTAAATSTIKAADINLALGNGNVTISTGAVGSTGADAGNITISSALSWATNKTLTLSAAGGVTGSSNISMTGGGVIFNQEGNTTYSGVISGTGASVTKQGSGTLTLTGLNTYTGNTAIDAGTLAIGGSGSLATNYAGNISNYGTFKYSSSAAQTMTGVMSGTGALVKDTGTSSTLTLSGSNIFTGNVTLGAGSLDLKLSPVGGTDTRNYSNTGTGTLTLRGDFSQTGVMSGSGNYAFNSAAGSTITLNGPNTFTGIALISGSVKLGTGSTITAGSVTATPLGLGNPSLEGTGSIDLNGQDITLATGKKLLTTSIHVASGSGYYTGIKLKNSTGTAYWRSQIAMPSSGVVSAHDAFAIDVAANATLEMSGGQSSSTAGQGMSFAKTGAGTLKYVTPVDGTTGQYFGNWTLAAGVVDITSTTAQGPNYIGPSMTIASGAELKIGEYNVNSLWMAYGNSASPGLTNNGTLTIYSNSSSTYSRTVSNSNIGITGNGTLIFTGGGNIKLGAYSNTFTGTTTITSGTTVETITGVSSLANSGGSNAISLLGKLKINGVSSGSSFDFKAKLTGNGNLEIPSGLVGLYADNSGFTGDTLIYSGATMYAGSMYTNTYLPTVAGSITNNGTLYFASAGVASAGYTLANNISGTGGITVNRSGADITLTGTLSYSGNTDIFNGKLTINSATAFNTSNTFNTTGTGGTLVYKSAVNSTFSGLMSGSYILVVDSGAGSLTLTANNTRTGATTITSGSLYVGNGGTSGQLGSGTITNNASLIINRSDAYSLSTLIGHIYSGTGNISVSSGGNLTIDRTISLSGANSLIDIFSSGNLTLGAVTLSDSGASGIIKFRANGGVTFSSTSSVLNASGSNGIITVSAGDNLLAGDTTTGYDINLSSAGSSALSTSATGTITLYQGNPNTTTLLGKIASTAAGGSSAKKYKTYGANATSLSGAITGTRNFYYRANPAAITVSGVTASKTYDGNTNALGYTSGGSVTGLSGEEVGFTSPTFSFTTASFDTPNAGTVKGLTLGGVSINNSSWRISGLSATISPGSTNTISKANLILSGTKTYDGTSSVSGSQLIATGVHSESFLVTGAGASGNLGTADVQTNALMSSVTGLTLGASNGVNTGLAANYNVLSTAGSSFTVQPATAILTATKTYDGSTSLTGSQLTITGVTVGGVTQTLGYSGTASLMDANVATANNYVSGTGLVLTNGTGTASNYVLPAYSYSANNNRATVNTKAIDVTLTSPSSTYTYDAVTSYATLASGLTAYTTNTPMVGSDSIASLNYAVTSNGVAVSTGVAQAGNFSVTPSLNSLSAGAVASNYSFTFNPLIVAVAKATLTVGGTPIAANKTYDRTTAATVSGGSLIGVLGSDSVTLTEAGTFASPNVGNGIAVTANDTISGSSASNYTLIQPTGLSADITAKALTVNNTTVANKAYSGTNTATLSGGTLVGVIAGDTVTLTEAGTFASVNASSSPIAVTAADTLGGGSAGNYTLTQPTGLSAYINKANATVTASSGTVTYTGLAQSVSGFTATGLVNGETAAVLSGVSAGATGTNAGSYASVATGTDNNYNLTFVNGALTINKANATVTASSGTTTYNGVAQSVSGFTVTGLVNNESAAVLTGVSAGVTATNAGTYASTATGTDTNYNLTFVPGSFTINKANATVTANSGTATYSGVAQSVSGFTAAGLVNGESATVLTGVTASGTGTNVGTYTSTASGTDTNYNLTFVPGSFTINKAHLTVTADNASKTYGAANPTLSATVSGFVNGETLGTSGVSGAGAASTTATALTGAGTAVITPSLGTLTASNYDFTNFVNGTLTINKANATVTASSGTATYTGLAQSVSGFTASGLVNGETATVLTGVSTTGGTGTNAGSYTHTASGTAANYNLTFVDGALTIGKASATVTANSGSTTYNGAAQSVSGFTATGLVNGETTAVLSSVTAGATGTNAGTYTATASGTDSNYNLTFVNGTYTINRAPLSVSLTGQTKVYDGTTNATLANGSLTLTGFMSGEGATVSQTQASYNSPNVLNANSVTASLAANNYTASSGTLLSNYVLPTSATGTGSITPARLSASGTKTYDGLVAFNAAGLTVSGVNGETFAATGSGTMGSKNVQTNQALSSVAGLSLSGNSGALTSNYAALATSDTQVSVTPLAVNLNAPSANKTYDSTTLYQVNAADLTALSSQLVGGDRVTAAQVTYADKNAGSNKRVMLNSVTINDDNGGNNYTVGKLDVNTGVINKAPLTVTVVSDARFVTQADAAGYAGVVYNGLVGGETASVLTTGTIARNNANTNTGAGQYTGTLQASGWQSGNYNISYVAGDYTIVGAHTLLVRVPTVSTTYGTAATYTPVAQYLDGSNNTIVTLTPTVTGNALTVNDNAGGSASFAITAANATLSSSGNVQAGGYNLQASNVVKVGNNFQNLVMTGGLTVNPKVLNSNLGVQPITKVYDGSASISNLGLNFDQPLAGVTTGDTVSLTGSGSFDDRHVATNKTVNLSLGLLGTDSANYALATPSFTTNTGSITQLASVTYTGASNGNWSDFSNWAGGAMPDRNNVAQVIVPTGKTVVYNSDQVGTIGSTLTVDGAVRFTSSNAFTLANTVSGAGDLQQRGNGMLTVSGTNTNFTGNLDIGSYQATLNNAQALGTGHVVASGGQLSVASGVTLSALHVDGAVTVDTAIKTTGDQVYNGALTFLSSGTAQAPNFESDAGNVDFLGTVSAGSGSKTAQRSLAVAAPQGSVLFNDQVGRMVKNLDFNVYLTSGLLDTSPYALTVTAPTIKLLGDVTTFDSQTYYGAVRVGNNTLNSNTRLLVSVDPSITFKGTVDDIAPAGKVNGLDVRAISLAAITGSTPVPTITFEDNVGTTSPLASLRLAAGTQSTVSGAMVTDIKTDDASRRDTNYKGDIVLKGNLTVDVAPEMIAEQLLAPTGSPTLTWRSGTPDFRLRLAGVGNDIVLPTNFHQNAPNQGGSSNSSGNSNAGVVNTTTGLDAIEAGSQWSMAHRTRVAQLAVTDAPMKVLREPSGQMVADVQVGNEATTLPNVSSGNVSRVQAQTVNVSSSGAFVQVREFAPQALEAQKPFVFELPADTFVHSREGEYLKLSATLSNGANLPRWVKFSFRDRSFSGEAPKHVKSLDVKVTATDRQGKRASTRIRLVFTHGSGS